MTDRFLPADTTVETCLGSQERDRSNPSHGDKCLWVEILDVPLNVLCPQLRLTCNARKQKLTGIAYNCNTIGLGITMRVAAARRSGVFI